VHRKSIQWWFYSQFSIVMQGIGAGDNHVIVNGTLKLTISTCWMRLFYEFAWQLATSVRRQLSTLGRSFIDHPKKCACSELHVGRESNWPNLTSTYHMVALCNTDQGRSQDFKLFDTVQSVSMWFKRLNGSVYNPQQGSVEPSLHSGFYTEPFCLLHVNHRETSVSN
jgi:hypothetical protein